MLAPMEAVLKLRDARELFEQPARTPFDDDYEPWCAAPGAVHLVTLLRANPTAHVVVELPPSGPGREEVSAALARYGRMHADRVKQEIRAEVRAGLLALVPAAIVFAGTLALSKLANSASSHWVANTLAEALVVIGWVVAWAPVAVFGTDVWILRSRRHAYKRLASRAVEVR
jgi:hypothetical protein